MRIEEKLNRVDFKSISVGSWFKITGNIFYLKVSETHAFGDSKLTKVNEQEMVLPYKHFYSKNLVTFSYIPLGLAFKFEEKLFLKVSEGKAFNIAENRIVDFKSETLVEHTDPKLTLEAE